MPDLCGLRCEIITDGCASKSRVFLTLPALRGGKWTNGLLGISCVEGIACIMSQKAVTESPWIAAGRRCKYVLVFNFLAP